MSHSQKHYQKLADSLQYCTKAFINGNHVDSQSNQTFTTINPATGQLITKITSCNEEDVNQAVAAARAAFEDRRWAGLAPAERKEIMYRFAQLIEDRQDEFAVMESLDSGKPIKDTLELDVPETVNCIKWHAEVSDKLEGRITTTDDQSLSMIVREPIGVVAAIIPWNFPMQMAAWKFAPILVTGNSLIIKPAKLTSLTMLKIAELAAEAGIPDGVVNVLPGKGEVIGKALALHPDVNLITFTGSTVVGKKLLEYSGQSNTKRVLLELGGKSPSIVMPDIKDIDSAAEQIAFAAFWNMGENCSANSRLIVHKDIKDRLLEKLIEKTKEWRTGDPLDPSNSLGAMVEKPHMEKVLDYIKTANKEGAKLIYGGEQILEESGGNFVPPTIFDNVTPDMTIAKEEIFGPVLAVLTCNDEMEAIALANDTEYGLHASIYTDDLNLAHRMSRAVRAGTVSVNCYSEGDISTPFGGFKQSGFFGRDKSILANNQYTEVKTIWIDIK